MSEISSEFLQEKLQKEFNPIHLVGEVYILYSVCANQRLCEPIFHSVPWRSLSSSVEFSCVRTVFNTITARILARSLAHFYCQYADRQRNL